MPTDQVRGLKAHVSSTAMTIFGWVLLPGPQPHFVNALHFGLGTETLEDAKGLIDMHRVRKFAVVLEPEEDGGFTVGVLSLPEIVTYGTDETEALAMAEDAIRLVIEDCAARGEPIPDGEPPRIREVSITLAA